MNKPHLLTFIILAIVFSIFILVTALPMKYKQYRIQKKSPDESEIIVNFIKFVAYLTLAYMTYKIYFPYDMGYVETPEDFLYAFTIVVFCIEVTHTGINSIGVEILSGRIKQRHLYYNLKKIFRNAKAKEIIWSILIIGIIVVASCIDLLGINLDNNGVDLNNIFSVQASVSTLSIALISLLVGMRNETVYGVSLTKYFMDSKYKIFKYKNIVKVSLFLIIIEYFVVSMKWINISIGIFIISIILIIIASANTFNVFKSNNEIKGEIEKFVKQNFDSNKLEDIQTDLKIAFASNDIIKQEEGFYILKKLFRTRINEPDLEGKISLKELEEAYVNSFIYIEGLKDIRKNYCFLNELSEIYYLTDIYGENINIWYKIQYEFYNALEMVNLKVLGDKFIDDLKYKIYINMEFKDGNEYYSKDYNTMQSFSSNVYYSIQKNDSVDDKTKMKILIKLYESDIHLIIDYLNDREKGYIAIKGFLDYIVLLIRKKEDKILNQTIFKDEDDCNIYTIKNIVDRECELFLSILIYMYHLWCNNIELKDFVANIIISNGNKSLNFLENIDISTLGNKSIDRISELLVGCKSSVVNGYCINKDIVKEFMIMFSIKTSDNNFRKNLEVFDNEYLMYFYKKFCSDYKIYEEKCNQFTEFMFPGLLSRVCGSNSIEMKYKELKEVCDEYMPDK